MATTSERKRLTVFDMWERFGITEHMGGVYATRELLRRCGIGAGQHVLEIGCGTGYTACLLAKQYGATVVAVDLDPRLLELAQTRIIKEGVSDKVRTLEADAQNLPFEPNTFDAVIIESVLAFCDQRRAASEIKRVLKPGGKMGDNEATYLKPPPDWLRDILSETVVGVRFNILPEDQWKEVYREAGFEDVFATVNKVDLWKQFLSHLQVDGLRKYLASVVRGFSDPDIRALFFNRDVLKALFKIWPYFGYGLYTARKPMQGT